MLGKNLGLRVIAEGVETEEELRCLHEKRCEEVQGYFFAEPMPAAKIPGWIEEAKEKGFIVR